MTMTNDKLFKYYQITLFRSILLEQGFTPDTVQLKSKDKE